MSSPWVFPSSSFVSLMWPNKVNVYNISTLVFSAAKNGVKSVISIFCCSVSGGNISFCH